RGARGDRHRSAACCFAAGYADQHQLSRYEIAIAIRGRLVERLNSARRCSRRAVVRTRASGHWAVMLWHYLGLADRMPDRQRLKTTLSPLDSVTSAPADEFGGGEFAERLVAIGVARKVRNAGGVTQRPRRDRRQPHQVARDAVQVG